MMKRRVFHGGRLVAAVAAFALVAPVAALACGWAGEDWDEAVVEEIVVGPDGKPVAESTPSATDPAFETRLGNRYRAGAGVAQDYAEALRHYRKAAALGYAAAENNIAGMYEHGLGVPRDDREAALWYRRAAEHGDPQAQHSLGMMLRDGRGVARDPKEAAHWITLSAEAGHLGALTDLADLYWRGQGVPKDPVKALAWWSVAAEQGVVRAAAMREKAQASLTPAQVAAAQELARELAAAQP